jgi:phosphoribosylglycinamide formyltransferase-1
VHFVSDELDAGAPIAQARLRVLETDTVETLAQRVHKREHVLYPRVIGWFADGRLRETEGTAYLDGRALTTPVMIEDSDD